MDEKNSGEAELDRLRKKWEEDQRAPLEYLRQVEAPAGKLFFITLPDGQPLTFRRWTHEEANRFTLLLFASKLTANQPLSEDEQKLYTAFKTEMVMDAVTDKAKWRNRIPADALDALYNTVAAVSFPAGAERFVDSDFGYLYGLIWFVYMRKTPSEVALLPESDVRMVQEWFAKWLEKVGKSGV